MRQKSPPEKSNKNNTKQKTRFEIDNKLDIHLTELPINIKMSQFRRTIQEKARTEIVIESNDLKLLDFYFGCSNMSIRSAMDGVASLILAEWQDNKTGGYTLLENSDSSKFVYSVTNDAFKKERNDAALQLVNDISKLNNDLKNQINSPNGISLDQVPNHIYNDMMKVMQPIESKAKAELKPNESITPATSISKDKFSISISRKDVGSNFDAFKLSYKSPFWTGSFTTSNFDLKYPSNINSSKNQTISYSTKEHKMSKKSSINSPAANIQVEINTKNETLPGILKYLNNKYNISFVSDSRRFLNQRADINLPRMPLHKALDIITTRYSNTEWELRESGFLIIRGPSNPTRGGNIATLKKQYSG